LFVKVLLAFNGNEQNRRKGSPTLGIGKRINNVADFSHQCATLNYEPEGYTHWFD